MKQLDDKVTGDLLEVFKRPRGRPPTGKALSGSDRQRLRRERLRAAGDEVLTITVSSEVAEALRRFVQFKDITQGEALTKIISDRLLRKR